MYNVQNGGWGGGGGAAAKNEPSHAYRFVVLLGVETKMSINKK